MMHMMTNLSFENRPKVHTRRSSFVRGSAACNFDAEHPPRGFPRGLDPRERRANEERNCMMGVLYLCSRDGRRLSLERAH